MVFRPRPDIPQNGGLQVSVVDSEGNPITASRTAPGVTVRVVRLADDTVVAEQVGAPDQSSFVFQPLPIGTYRVEVTRGRHVPPLDTDRLRRAQRPPGGHPDLPARAGQRPADRLVHPRGARRLRRPDPADQPRRLRGHRAEPAGAAEHAAQGDARRDAATALRDGQPARADERPLPGRRRQRRHLGTWSDRTRCCSRGNRRCSSSSAPTTTSRSTSAASSPTASRRSTASSRCRASTLRRRPRRRPRRRGRSRSCRSTTTRWA